MNPPLKVPEGSAKIVLQSASARSKTLNMKKRIYLAVAMIGLGLALLIPTVPAAKNQLSEYFGGIRVGYQGIKISQMRCGVTAAMTAGSITVSDINVTANSIILLTGQVTGGTGGALRVGSRTAGTSFVINSSSGTDTGTVGYCIVEP